MYKKSYLFLLISFFPVVVNAQCIALQTYPAETSFEITTYNDEGEISSATKYQVEEVRKESERTLIMMRFIITNKKGKEIDKGNRSIIISGNNYNINLSSVIPEYKSDDPIYIQYSCTPKPGDDIPEFSRVTTYEEDNMGQISIISNKVGLDEGKYGTTEEIITELGTFNCIKLTYKVRYDLQDFVYTEWIDQATGRTIKIERINKKGKLDSYSLLTKFN
ncbi:MAG: hypothetical protein H7Y00_04480 [Fimbriimonadaceae bacterium]|nr:hypothetical protein [Chitinophagales bacterium]